MEAAPERIEDSREARMRGLVDFVPPPVWSSSRSCAVYSPERPETPLRIFFDSGTRAELGVEVDTATLEA
jgi:hypothetical protein